MKNTLQHLPKHKQDELAFITEIIREKVNSLEMVILFGSYARGNWVEDVYTEGHTTYEYKSDFDILAVTATDKTAKVPGLWRNVKKAIKKEHIDTPVTLIVHGIDFINNRLERGQYFFTDIKKEGIMLYDSNNFELAEARQLHPNQRAGIAKSDFDHWLESAEGFYKAFGWHLNDEDYKLAAFNLHQSSEALYACVMLVFSNHKPKSHDLTELMQLAANYVPVLITAFPQNTDDEKKCFELLNDAYVRARYDKSYKITKEQLQYLADRVKTLMNLTEKVCVKKIESFI